MTTMKKSVYVTDQGATVHRKDGGLAVMVRGRQVGRWPLDELDRLVIFGNVQVTTQVLGLMLRHGVHVAFFSTSGRYRGQLVSPEGGQVFLRLAQHARHADTAFRLVVARRLVRQKVTDARARLQRFRRNHAETSDTLAPAIDRLLRIARRLDDVTNQPTLRGLEGEAAAVYFGVFDALLRGPMVFERRSQHPAHNEVNALLNLGYTILATELAGRLESVGFDPRIGLYHGVRYGRVSLALDLIEAYRVDVIDRLTCAVVNRRMMTQSDFEDTGVTGPRLTRSALARYLAVYEEALGSHLPSAQSVRTRIDAQIASLRRAVLSGDAHLFDPQSDTSLLAPTAPNVPSTGLAAHNISTAPTQSALAPVSDQLPSQPRPPGLVKTDCERTDSTGSDADS